MSRRLLVHVLLALLMLGSLAGPAASAKSSAAAGPAVTRSSPVTRGSTYLALGDSVTFGYQETTVTPKPDYFNQASFLGYPEQIGKALHVGVNNLACPGETSGSLIDAAALSNGCENTYRNAFPLHVRYRGSQLDDAVSFLRRHPSVRLVSLMIGANDLFVCQAHTSQHCLAPAEQRPVLSQITRNVRRILSAIRSQAHYRRQLAVVNYYSLDYASPLINAQSKLLNTAQDAGAEGFDVRFVNGYSEFRAGSVKFGNQPCLAGLLNQLGGVAGRCGVHPTYAGQALLAQAVLKAIRLF